jgi:hypothetical protein
MDFMIVTVSSDYFPSVALSDCSCKLNLYFEVRTEFLNNWNSCFEGLIGNTNFCVCYRQYLIFLLVFLYLSARPCACCLTVSLFFSIAPDIWKGFLQVRVWLVPLRSMQKWNSIPRHANGAFISKSNDNHAPLRFTDCGSWVPSSLLNRKQKI